VIRPARAADNAQIAAIWNAEALATAATTDTGPRTPEAQAAWLAAHTDDYPAIVAVDGAEVLAFGGLTPYRPRASYARTVEDSVYVKDGYRGKRLGAAILDELIARARARRHHSMAARVTSENTASLRLHERLGFVQVGAEREVAYKLARWLDVVTLQLML
jgi:phosphinothricin acetyltransferase